MNRNDPSYFSEEYRARVSPRNPSWIALRSFTFLLTWGRDAIFPFAPARQLDHLHYRSLGREMPLFDVVPLSVASHQLVTRLRDVGFRTPVNLALRLAGLVWLSIDFGIPTVLVLFGSGHGAVVKNALAFAFSFPAFVMHNVASLGGFIR